MSFLLKTTPVVRTVAFRPAPRLLSTTIAKQNVVKDTAKAVDRTVSDQLVKGIDAGIDAKDKVAEAAGVQTEKAKGEASKVAGQAEGKAAELKGQAKGKAEEIKGKMS